MFSLLPVSVNYFGRLQKTFSKLLEDFLPLKTDDRLVTISEGKLESFPQFFPNIPPVSP